MKRKNGVLVSPGRGGVYGERMMGKFRVWDPKRSKFAALAELEPSVDLSKDMDVLYLGAANGTTVSHIADYVNVVYAVEFAPRPMQDLLEVARKRENIVPIMADARLPATYAPLLTKVDMLFQDVAQPDQVAIALRNCAFLKEGGDLILVIKARSVNVAKDPKEVFAEAEEELKAGGMVVDKMVGIGKYHTDHAVLLCRKD